MMNNLVAQITNTMGKTKVLELTRILKEEEFALPDLIDLTFHHDKNIAFRAAWILENLFLQDPERYENHLIYLIRRIKEVKHASCQRHYAKILMHLTRPKGNPAIKLQLEHIDLEPVVEQCFDWLIDPKVKTAVKCFATEVLFNLRHRYPWIKDELESQVKFLMLNGSAGINSRGRKIIEGLKANG